MKRKAVVWMVVLSVFLLILAGVGYWQRNNLTAIYYAVKYDKEQQQEPQVAVRLFFPEPCSARFRFASSRCRAFAL